MNIVKKVAVSIVAGSLIFNTFSSIKVIEATDESNTKPSQHTQYGLGCNIDYSVLDTQKEINEVDYERANLSTSLDLSSDSAFPPIGYQGYIGSCVAWATTYYTFTYMVHDQKGITSTASNAYSPSWTYNLINGGIDDGSIVPDAINVLINQGALTMSECPYSTSNYSLDWSNNTQAMINALSTRAYINGDYNYFNISNVCGTDFNNQINTAKYLLNNNHPLVVTMQATEGLTNSTWRQCSDSSHINQHICVRNTSGSGGHAMTIVGYDDTVWCDVNGNGTVDTGETGAFKLANSWGTGWGNDGYIWILYDALLSTSQIKSAYNSSVVWDSSMENRVPFFARTGYTNVVYYFDVKDYNVGYVSKVTLTTSRRNQLRATSLGDNIQIYQRYSNGSYNTQIGFTGTIVLDHPSSENISSHLSGYSWGVNISDMFSDGYSVSGISCKLVDNLNNTIKTYYSGGSVNGTSNSYTTLLNLTRGDVDYSGILTLSDADAITDYLAHIIDFSNVQKVLADYNNDGIVDSTDVSALRLYLLSKGVDVSSLDVKIEAYVQQGLISMEAN